MARVRFTHNTFSTGIISQKVQGNTDFEQYNNSLEICENFLVQHTGGIFKRPGTCFVAATKNNQNARLIPFIYDADSSYICEFGISYIRFFTKHKAIQNSDGSIYELTTPFSSFDEIQSIKYFQSGNVLFLNTKQGIFEMTRQADTIFTIKPEAYTNPPATFLNDRNIALKPSAADGNITITVVDAEDVQKKPDAKYKPVFFDSYKGGYVILTYVSASLGQANFYLKIKSIADDAGTGFKKCECTLDKEWSYKFDDGTIKLPNTDAVQSWRVSAFSKDRGLPRVLSLFEGRMFLANNESYPLGIWGSSVMHDDFYDFSLGANDADAVQVNASVDKSDQILWIEAQAQLFVGTRGGVYIAGSANVESAITPSNFKVRLFSSVGASALQPVRAMDCVFFVDSSCVNVHEIILNQDSQTYQSNDLSLIANDLTQSGIIAHAWQQSPTKTYWCAVNRGFLCSLTYLKNNNILAWAKHILAGRNVFVEDLATIPSKNCDVVYMIVHREINGKIVRYIEFLKNPFNPMQDADFEQFYVDSGSTKQLLFQVKEY